VLRAYVNLKNYTIKFIDLTSEMQLKDDELVWFRFEHLTKSNPRHINEHNKIWVSPEAGEINFAIEYSWLEILKRFGPHIKKLI